MINLPCCSNNLFSNESAVQDPDCDVALPDAACECKEGMRACGYTFKGNSTECQTACSNKEQACLKKTSSAVEINEETHTNLEVEDKAPTDLGDEGFGLRGRLFKPLVADAQIPLGNSISSSVYGDCLVRTTYELNLFA